MTATWVRRAQQHDAYRARTERARSELAENELWAPTTAEDHAWLRAQRTALAAWFRNHYGHTPDWLTELLQDTP